VKLGKQEFEILSQQIQERFPLESASTYFDSQGKSKEILFSKYYNVRSNMMPRREN
jgi:hypothetical protein